MTAAKKDDRDKKGKRKKPVHEPEQERHSDSDGKVYDIPAEEHSSLESALKELEEHADTLESKKRAEKRKRAHDSSQPASGPEAAASAGEESIPGAKKEPPPDAGEQADSPTGKDSRRDATGMVARDEYERLEEEREALSREAAELKDKWLRSVAEFENYRKRSRKEWELLKLQSKADVILEILDVVDDFERAFAVAGDLDDEFVQGIQLIYQKLQQILQKFGVAPIDALNTRFDPNYHMAIGQVESDSTESGHVVEETQKGYLMGDTVLRPAKVIIAK